MLPILWIVLLWPLLRLPLLPLVHPLRWNDPAGAVGCLELWRYARSPGIVVILLGFRSLPMLRKVILVRLRSVFVRQGAGLRTSSSRKWVRNQPLRLLVAELWYGVLPGSICRCWCSLVCLYRMGDSQRFRCALKRLIGVPAVLLEVAAFIRRLLQPRLFILIDVSVCGRRCSLCSTHWSFIVLGVRTNGWAWSAPLPVMLLLRGWRGIAVFAVVVVVVSDNIPTLCALLRWVSLSGHWGFLLLSRSIRCQLNITLLMLSGKGLWITRRALVL